MAVIAALVFGWAAAWARLAARRKQRQLVERAAGVRHRLPDSHGPLGRGLFQIVVGVVLCAVAGGAILLGLRGIHADERHAARAVRTTAQVLSQDDESLRVRTGTGRRMIVGAGYPEDYGIGTTVTVLEDGRWRRLASEPYDAMGWQVLTLATGLSGLSLLATGVLARRRSAALRRGAVPALRVLERVDHHGRIWVYAADDDAGRVPCFSCVCAPVLGPEDESDGDGGVMDDGDEDFLFRDVRLREAVVFGALYEGGELVLSTTDGDGDPAVMRTVAPIRQLRPGKGPVLIAPNATDVEPGNAERRRHDAAERGAADLKPSGRPMRWGATPLARAGGLALTALFLGGVRLITDSLRTDGLGWDVIPLLGFPMLIAPAAVLLNWRVTADRTGLWLTGGWKVRHLPWERLRAAVYMPDGSVEILLDDGGLWELPGVGWPWAERCLRLRPSYVRMVDEVSTLQVHPELRPTEQSSPTDRGRPLGPALAVLLVLSAISSFVV
ncbi:hypothetical protein [Streptomyces sp. NPDC051572]|uniref:hypothetical protein n=1 Tax=Streptomyces sp. NPDC051572 TaxID=3155802 RepID=UPI00344B32A0